MMRKTQWIAAAVALGFAATAPAQEVDDVEIIVGNLGPAGEAFADGMAEALDVLVEEQSTAEVADTLIGGSLFGGSVLSDTASALVAGSSLDALGLGAALIGGAANAGIQPYLGFVDDPTGQPLDTVFDPDDLETIADNLEPAGEALIAGQNGDSGLQQAGIEALQGNLYEGGALGPTDGAVLHAFEGAIALQMLTEGTNYQDLAFAVLVPLLVGAIAAEPVFDAYDDPFGTVFAAAEPATGPLIEAIEDF